MEQSSDEVGAAVTSTPVGATSFLGWLGSDVWECKCRTRHHKTCIVQAKIDALIRVYGEELGKRKWAAMKQSRRRKRLRTPNPKKNSEDAASALLVLSAGQVDSRFAHGGDQGSGALPSLTSMPSKQMRSSSSSSPTAASFSTLLPSCPEAQDRERIESILKMLTAEELREVLNQSLNDPRALAAMAILFPSEKYSSSKKNADIAANDRKVFL